MMGSRGPSLREFQSREPTDPQTSTSETQAAQGQEAAQQVDETTGLRAGAERGQRGDTGDSRGKGSVVVHQVSKWEVLSKGQRTSQRPRAAAGSVNNLAVQVYECSV